MTDDEIESLLDGLESELRAGVSDALASVAAEFAEALDAATELVAARFSVSGIKAMWRRRTGGIVSLLRSIAGRSAGVTAADAGAGPLPADWEAGLDGYLDGTRALLDAVGDLLASEASLALAEGMNAGEGVDGLKARLKSLFAGSGTQLGGGRADRIAVTESTRAWNAGALAAARALTGPERPLVKQWVTRGDERVRPQHREANGQLRLLEDAFDVGGTPMMYPGDPSAPAELTVGCRCVMRTAAAQERRSSLMTDSSSSVTAAADAATGAMVALMPTARDAARLALDGGEPADQLHTTLVYLGDAADWTPEQRGALVTAVSYAARRHTPVAGRAFGGAQWNPGSDEPAWVWNVGDDTSVPGSALEDVKADVDWAVDGVHDGPGVPPQYTPWSPHICAVYGPGDAMAGLVSRVGPVVFDRVRIAFAGQYTDIPLSGGYWGDASDPYPEVDRPAESGSGSYAEQPEVAGWSTPGGTALAFEGQQTGDGRIFAPGALRWDDVPLPLQYADEMNGGHDGARLAGEISALGREGGRITGSGVLYLAQSAGAEAAALLGRGAPLGVSVDLDSVDLEMVDASGVGASGCPAGVYGVRLATASLLAGPDGGLRLTGVTETHWTASGASTVGESSRIDIVCGPDGRVPAAPFELAGAAGDPDAGGTVVDRQLSGDVLLRITGARVRGATLVAIPAFAGARIVLDAAPGGTGAGEYLAAAQQPSDYDRVVRHVRKALLPVTAADVAAFLRVPVGDVRRYLARAARRGLIVRVAHGRYAPNRGSDMKVYTAGSATDTADGTAARSMTASAVGRVDLPVAPRDTPWDGPGAVKRVFAWADGDTSKLDEAFAYRSDDADPGNPVQSDYKLGYADLVGGELTIVPRGVFAAQAAVEGARGGTDIPQGEVDAVRARLSAVRAHVDEVTGGDAMDGLNASAWAAVKDLPPMPAAWFAEPTAEELPPGGPGVNYLAGRIFGWVARAGEPHAGYARKITVDSLGRVDTTHFLRQRFTLDDGSVVKAGAFTMNVGHHRDGAECETDACQFDDSRTVAGIVTVGMSDRGLWFSGAAAPWLSEWDRRVFLSVQPSYHMLRGPSGVWQLRAVLSVPVPGHSSPLLASAVVDRSNLALTAAATMAGVEEAVAAAATPVATPVAPVAPAATPVAVIDYGRIADEVLAALKRAENQKSAEAAELAALVAEARTLGL